MSQEPKQLFTNLLEKNQYLTLATKELDSDLTWCSILTYVSDDRCNLYFMSDPKSKHISHILNNKSASLTIFDSTQPWGYGLGVQMTCNVTEITVSEFPKVAKMFFERSYPYGGKPKIINVFRDVINKGIYRFYRITPQEIWVTDPDADVDGRLLVEL